MERNKFSLYECFSPLGPAVTCQHCSLEEPQIARCVQGTWEPASKKPQQLQSEIFIQSNKNARDPRY